VRKKALLKISSYSPDHFLNRLLRTMNLKNDAALARTLEVTPAIVSRIRNKKAPISANLLLMIHDVSDIAIPELRRMMGDSRRLFS
jgi:plasmid maintenance system antidote protein VapI